MASDDHTRFTIIGGGLAGALMATYLGRAGYDVDVYERRPDPTGDKVVGGRSINLAISVRGIHALQEVGLADEILNRAIPMRGRMIHSRGGRVSFQPYGRDKTQAINSVSRAGLNLTLLQAARKHPNVRVHFDQRCQDVDLDKPSASLINVVTGERQTVEGDILIGADGAFSTVRGAMQRLDRFNYRQDYLEHGYKELTIPPGPDGRFLLEPNALHIWPRRSFMMIALPNHDRSFTCTLFWPFEGPNSFHALQSDDDIERFFSEEFRDAVLLMPTLAQDFQRNPVGSLVTVRCSPWSYCDKVVLLGDACHAVVPFYGQGMNAAFEDCTVLNQCISTYAPDWRRTFSVYDALRKTHVDALADLAIGNFLEMRDRTNSTTFRIQKKVERTLHRLLPFWFLPLYSMVTFSRIPYAEAVSRAKRQYKVITAMCLAVLVILVLAAGAAWWRTNGAQPMASRL
ncbi:MAG: FAD-dependent monooxygenase [Planctomycetes bacterium]|nr:FAD-dependent monooxygenase [Planctomycetota bacterium]